MGAAPGAAERLAGFAIDAGLQERFCAASGDRNGVHVSDEAARAAGLEGRVVHGAHLLLRALEALAASRPAVYPATVSARFAKPVFVGEEVALWLDAGAHRPKLWLQIGRLKVMEATLGDPAPQPLAEPPLTLVDDAPLGPPQAPDLAALSGELPALPLSRRLAGLEDLFPALSARIGLGRIAAVALDSTMVGMRVPGERSLLMALTLDFTEQATAAPAFRLERMDQRLGVCDIAATGLGVASKIRALARPAPTPPVAMSALPRARVIGRHQGQRALIIGGARGLGRIAAGLLSAGGAEVWLTWRESRDAAETLASELRALGGQARTFRFDAAPEGRANALPDALGDVDAVYYFATPRIFERGRGGFDRARFDRFSAVYVEGLSATLEALQGRLSPRRSLVWFPSTVALDQPVQGLMEYASAKAAAEAAAPYLEQAHKGLRARFTRMPRIATDQTVSPMPAPAESGVEAMMKALAEMQELLDETAPATTKTMSEAEA